MKVLTIRFTKIMTAIILLQHSNKKPCTRVAELVGALDLGSSGTALESFYVDSHWSHITKLLKAVLVELVDTLVLGTSWATSPGSSPGDGTIFPKSIKITSFHHASIYRIPGRAAT